MRAFESGLVNSDGYRCTVNLNGDKNYFSLWNGSFRTLGIIYESLEIVEAQKISSIWQVQQNMVLSKRISGDWTASFSFEADLRFSPFDNDEESPKGWYPSDEQVMKLVLAGLDLLFSNKSDLYEMPSISERGSELGNYPLLMKRFKKTGFQGFEDWEDPRPFGEHEYNEFQASTFERANYAVVTVDRLLPPDQSLIDRKVETFLLMESYENYCRYSDTGISKFLTLFHNKSNRAALNSGIFLDRLEKQFDEWHEPFFC